MNELIEFLRAALDEDERVARADLTPSGSITVSLGLSLWDARDVGGPEMPSVWEQGKYLVAKDLADGHAEHIARWDPARVLAEVNAKRRLLDRLRDERGFYRDDIASGTAEPVIRLLALPYADRPGYREEWRPDGS